MKWFMSGVLIRQKIKLRIACFLTFKSSSYLEIEKNSLKF
jgi:hypothetical protein